MKGSNSLLHKHDDTPKTKRNKKTKKAEKKAAKEEAKAAKESATEEDGSAKKEKIGFFKKLFSKKAPKTDAAEGTDATE